MKIQLISDTHTFDYTINPEADIVVHCGDSSNGDFKYILQFKEKCDELNKPHIYIVGNHDAYGKSYEQLYNELYIYKINYLTHGKSFTFMDKTFVGGTLFTDFTLNSNNDPTLIDKFKQEAKHCVNDFYHIRKENRLITPEDYITLHNLDWNWISKFKNNPNVIVCTHFPPHPSALSEYWKERGGFLNPYFINTKSLDGFYYWLSGHVHHHFNYQVDTCNFICNPLGYPNEAYLNGFHPNYLIEV